MWSKFCSVSCNLPSYHAVYHRVMQFTIMHMSQFIRKCTRNFPLYEYSVGWFQRTIVTRKSNERSNETHNKTLKNLLIIEDVVLCRHPVDSSPPKDEQRELEMWTFCRALRNLVPRIKCGEHLQEITNETAPLHMILVGIKKYYFVLKAVQGLERCSAGSCPNDRRSVDSFLRHLFGVHHAP